MASKPLNIHGTCVTIGNNAALLRGESGSGKSDLAYRFMQLPHDPPHNLIADDRVNLSREDGKIICRPPENIAGMIELRGIGLITCPYTPSAHVRISIDLVSYEQVPRMQFPFEDSHHTELMGIKLPSIKLYPFEASAPLKLQQWIKLAESYAQD